MTGRSLRPGPTGWLCRWGERFLREPVLMVLLLALALALRLWALADVPPGWRDDELSNSLVISRHVLEGDLRLLYPDASGHEFLYHAVNALFLEVFGPGLWGIRLLSVLIGSAVVGLTFRLAREMFGAGVAWPAALGVATSFWALMYSRVGQRHISAVLMSLVAFLFLWRVLLPREQVGRQGGRPLNAALAGLGLGLGLYTYFAGRVSPMIVISVALYLALVDRPWLQRRWRSLAFILLIAAALYLPLWFAGRATPGAEARIDELALPVKALGQGDWGPLFAHLQVTLQMFHADGDDEWLYNVAHRPVFGPVGAVLIFGGVLLAVFRSLPRRIGGRADARYFFLLTWLACGLAPGVLSVPAASLGHTLLALPVTYIFPALALNQVWRWLPRRLSRNAARILSVALVALFVGTETYRGLYDYFSYWPQRGFVRLLHNADYRDVARFLNGCGRQKTVSLYSNDAAGFAEWCAAGGRDLVIGADLAGRWPQEAFRVDLREEWRARWFDPRRALVAPATDGYLVTTVFPGLDPVLAALLGNAERARSKTFTLYQAPSIPAGEPLARFDNGLALVDVSDYRWDENGLLWTTTWLVERPLTLPPNPLLSKPPPPGFSAEPHLALFVHLLEPSGAYVTGQDGLGVDPYTLQPGDRFIHLHRLAWEKAEAPAGHSVRLGLYDPHTRERWLTGAGNDSVLLFTLAEDGR